MTLDPVALGMQPHPEGGADTTLHEGGADTTLHEGGQYLVDAGEWQTARPGGDGAVLVACVVAPGFEFADFSLAQ